MGWSNASCLWSENGRQCWQSVVQGTGYCKKHQKEPFEKAYDERPSNWGTIAKQVLQRDKAICHVCGLPGADQVDHIQPLSEGGSNQPYNLKPIHGNVAPFCHREKSQKQTAEHKKKINSIKIRGKKY